MVLGSSWSSSKIFGSDLKILSVGFGKSSNTIKKFFSQIGTKVINEMSPSFDFIYVLPLIN